MHSKNLGIIGELKVASKFIEQGFNVFTSFGDNSEIDLIIEKDGELKKVQVKTTEKTTNNEKMEWRVDKSRLNFSGSYKEYYKHIDAFALYCFENDYVGYIDVCECKNTASITLRLTPTKNNQTENIKFAKDYQIGS